MDSSPFQNRTIPDVSDFVIASRASTFVLTVEYIRNVSELRQGGNAHAGYVRDSYDFVAPLLRPESKIASNAALFHRTMMAT
jgi:hypothetical protein